MESEQDLRNQIDTLKAMLAGVPADAPHRTNLIAAIENFQAQLSQSTQTGGNDFSQSEIKYIDAVYGGDRVGRDKHVYLSESVHRPDLALTSFTLTELSIIQGTERQSHNVYLAFSPEILVENRSQSKAEDTSLGLIGWTTEGYYQVRPLISSLEEQLHVEQPQGIGNPHELLCAHFRKNTSIDGLDAVSVRAFGSFCLPVNFNYRPHCVSWFGAFYIMAPYTEPTWYQIELIVNPETRQFALDKRDLPTDGKLLKCSRVENTRVKVSIDQIASL